MAAVASAPPQVIAAFSESWAKQKGVEGLAQALALPTTPRSANFIVEIAAACAKTDPRAAFELLSKQDQRSHSIVSAQIRVLQEWGKHDPAEARKHRS